MKQGPRIFLAAHEQNHFRLFKERCDGLPGALQLGDDHHVRMHPAKHSAARIPENHPLPPALPHPFVIATPLEPMDGTAGDCIRPS